MNIVEFQDVTFATNKHYNSLQNINFQLKKGEKALLFASNDSGVIEFFRVMLGFENAFSGIIQYKGIDIKKLKYKAANILYIPKNLVFFEKKSLEYNIKYFIKLRERNKGKVEEIFENIINKYDFQVFLNNKVKDLSAIDRIKLCFARSDFRDIDLILIEDIFEDLLNSEQQLIVRLLKDFIKNHGSASLIWLSNNELIEHFSDFEKYILEFGSLSLMP